MAFDWGTFGAGTVTGGIGGGLISGLLGGGEEEAPSFMELLSQLPEAAQIGMDTTQQIAPQQAQLQLDLLQQYGIPIAETQKNAFEQLYPQTGMLPEFLAQTAMEGAQAGLTANEQRIINDAVRSNLGEQAVSPFGTQRLGREYLDYVQGRQGQFLNLGQALSGRVPLYQAQTPQYTDYAAQVTPSLVVGGGQQQYQQQLQQQQMQNQGLSDLFSGIGSIGGMLLGGPAGAAAGGMVGPTIGGAGRSAGLSGTAGGGNSWGINRLSYGG